MTVDRRAPKRYPWWQLILLGLVAMVEALFRPLGRMWRSDDPLDTYGLAHFGSVAGDAMVAIALAGSVFFEIPVGKAGVKVAAFLALTIAPLAVAGPFLVPLLDRAGPGARSRSARRSAEPWSACTRPPVRHAAAVPRRVPAAGPVEGPRDHEERARRRVRGTERGARARERPPRSHRRGRSLAGGRPAFGLLELGGAEAVLYGAAVAYGITAMLNLRLPHPHVKGGQAEVSKRGAIPQLTAPAIGAAGLRAASGFLLFALAFALRRSGEPTWWFAVLAGAATAGAFLGDLIAPRLPANLREEAVVIGCLIGAGVGATLSFFAFELVVLILFAIVVGTSSELGRLAFQTLMHGSPRADRTEGCSSGTRCCSSSPGSVER